MSAFSIVSMHVSPGHNFFGRHGRPPGEHPLVAREEIMCVAGRGIEGDRFLDHRADYVGQITFFSLEVHRELCDTLGVRDRGPEAFRRNVIVAGDDLNGYVGREFEIQGVRFVGVAECAPCYWMERAFSPGAEAALRGRGGLRARILGDGVLRRSPCP